MMIGGVGGLPKHPHTFALQIIGARGIRGGPKMMVEERAGVLGLNSPLDHSGISLIYCTGFLRGPYFLGSPYFWSHLEMVPK